METLADATIAYFLSPGAAERVSEDFVLSAW
jgi:hypothetical protein